MVEVAVLVPEIVLEETNSQQLESNPPHLSLDASQSEEKSRRFSQVPPASSTSPNAVKMGHFAVIPTSDSINEPIMPTISITSNSGSFCILKIIIWTRMIC